MKNTSMGKCLQSSVRSLPHFLDPSIVFTFATVTPLCFQEIVLLSWKFSISNDTNNNSMLCNVTHCIAIRDTCEQKTSTLFIAVLNYGVCLENWRSYCPSNCMQVRTLIFDEYSKCTLCIFRAFPRGNPRKSSQSIFSFRIECGI